MIGIVVAGLFNLPKEMLVAAQSEIGQQKQIYAVQMLPDESAESRREALVKAVQEVDNGDGAIVFVDDMDGIAGHITRSIIDDMNFMVVGGVNVPMLSSAMQKRAIMSMEKLAKYAAAEGKKSIFLRM